MTQRAILIRDYPVGDRPTTEEMEINCANSTDPISLEPWSSIDRYKYVGIGELNDRQCFDLDMIIGTFESQLATGRQPYDPTNNVSITANVLCRLCAQYVAYDHGFDLPPLLHNYVYSILNRDDQVVPTADNNEDQMVPEWN
jgi:hypothetical protein